MPDKVSLLINDKKVEKFLSYKVDSDIFEAADAFEFELADPDIEVSKGSRCKLFVNDRLELNGIIDRVAESYNKQGVSLTVSGRDLMGQLVDSYCEEFITLEGIKLENLVKRLLKKFPFINIKDVSYGQGDKNRAVPLKHKTEEFEFTQIQPGDTIFEVLRSYALTRGMLFFSMPDGRFIFGQPLTKGAAQFTLICRKDGKDNNILEGQRVEDVSRSYSKIKIIGQRQGTDNNPLINIPPAEITDKAFPFYKPFVGLLEHDGQDAKKYAKILMDKQQFESFQLNYKTYAHSQNGTNWQVNAVCHVKDEALQKPIDNDFLIYGRTFEMSKQGVFTSLRLSKLGVLPA